MPRPILSGLSLLAVSLGSGLLSGMLLMAGARWGMPPVVAGPIGEGAWTQRSRAAFTYTGFSDPEFDSQTSRHFSWTGGSPALRFPHLDRSQVYRLALAVRAGRPEGIPLPLLSAAVDGVLVTTTTVSNDPRRIEIDLPLGGHGATVSFKVSPTFVPGPNDNRTLGIMVDEVSISPVGGSFRPNWAVTWRLGAAVAACVFGLLLCGLRGRLALAAAVVEAVSFAWLLLQDAAFMGTYVEHLLSLGAGVGLAGVVVAVVRARWPAPTSVDGWHLAAGIVLALTAVKVALFWHPLAIIGDAWFQVHRAQLVHAGTYFFTSVTPRPFFEFPYPIGLYVAAQPFWSWFPSDLDLVRLLRVVSLAADAIVGVVLYAAARRQWNDRVTALFCAVLWPLARAPIEAVSNANLTNVFGQALFGIGLAAFAWLAAGTAFRVPALVSISALLTAAFLSHFGTTLVGVVILGVVGAMLVTIGRAHVRRAGLWLCALTLAAAAVSWVAYYSHFTDVYRRTYASVAMREVDASSKMVAPPSVKFQRWAAGVGDDYGLPSWPVLLTAGAGVVLLVRRRRRDGLSLVLMGWVLAWMLLSALGIFTAYSLRANLATAPAFAGLCAVALGALAARSRAGIALAIALALVIGWDGLRVALTCIGLDPRW